MRSAGAARRMSSSRSTTSGRSPASAGRPSPSRCSPSYHRSTFTSWRRTSGFTDTHLRCSRNVAVAGGVAAFALPRRGFEHGWVVSDDEPDDAGPWNLRGDDHRGQQGARPALHRRDLPEGRPEAVDELLADDFVPHTWGATGGGKAGLKAAIKRVSAGLSDTRMTIEDMIAEGDSVASA